MNNDRQDASEKRFWDGKSSLNEERLLKSNSDDAYFNALKDAAEEKMDWRFEDFMQQTATVTEEHKVVKGHFPFQKLLWIAAIFATAILTVWKWNPIPKENNTVAKTENSIGTPADIQDASQPKANTPLVSTNKTTHPKSQPAIEKIASNTLGIRHRKAVNPTSIATAVPEADTLGAYEPQFVLVNGNLFTVKPKRSHSPGSHSRY